MDTTQTVLEAEGIHRDFPTAEATLPVLKGLSLRMKAGETVAITGASGVGKSTFLQIVGGLDRPTSGEVTVKGVSLNQQTEKQLAGFRNETIGFVFQFHHLMQDFSALENVMIPMLIAGHTRSVASDKAELLLEQVGLKDRLSHRPNQLSGGEQQRVAVARSLANDPHLVLADEPTGNLDTGTGRKLHDLLLHLNAEKNLTLLVATHNQELAEQCDRHLEMNDGVFRE